MIQTNASPTLDGLFRRILARQPDAWALLDPLNKPRVTGQPPKRLTFAQADRAISALSAHFIEAGLPANSVVAIQLPNTVEFMLTVLAAHRAGLIVVNPPFSLIEEARTLMPWLAKLLTRAGKGAHVVDWLTPPV